MKAYLLIILIFFAACDIQKSAIKSKSDLDLVTEKETKSFRSGDSVSYRPGKKQYRDTTIYRVTENNTRLETVYDSNGDIRDINCYAAQIEELTRENTQLKYAEKNKQSEKAESANFDWVIYLVVGIVLIFGMGFFFLFKTVIRNSKAIDIIVGSISKE